MENLILRAVYPVDGEIQRFHGTLAEAHSEPCETSKMDLFTKSAILDFSLGSE